MTNCIHCDKPLKKIGTARKNGKQTHGDWASRNLHKKCLKDYRLMEHYRYMRETYGK